MPVTRFALTLSLAGFFLLNAPAFTADPTPTQTPPSSAQKTDTSTAATSATTSNSNNTGKTKKVFAMTASQDALKITDDIALAEKQAQENPDDPEAHFLLAAAYSRSPHLDKAFWEMKKTKELLKAKQDFEFIDRTITDYEAVRQEQPNDTVVLYRLAMAYFFKGYTIEKYPHHYKNAPTGAAIDFYDKAQTMMRQVIALDPQDTWAMNYLGYLVSDNGKHLSKGIDLWQESLRINDRDNAGAYLLLSQAYMQKGDIQKALVYGAKGLAIQQSVGLTLP